MDANASLFLTVNGFVRSTPWLPGPLTLYAEYGPVLFTGLLIAGRWIARRDGDPVRVAAAVWAPSGTLLHQVLLRPVVAGAADPAAAVAGGAACECLMAVRDK